MIRLLALLMIGSLAAPRSASALCSYYLFLLDGSQISPPGSASGVAEGSLFLCSDRHLTGTIQMVLNETVTAVHLHGPAGYFETGPLVFDLPLPNENGVIHVDIGPLPAGIEYMFEWNSYVDVHTIEHPEGAIRGQVHPEGLPVSPSTWGGIKQFLH